jgi:hypothetical protein
MKDNRIMETHEVAFPFVRDKYEGPFDGEFAADVDTWRPGTRCETDDDGYEEEWQADAMGKMVLHVVGRYKPGKYQERTFYLRSFIDPSGRAFGKDNLRVISSPAFNRMLKGYRHKFVLPETEAAS